MTYVNSVREAVLYNYESYKDPSFILVFIWDQLLSWDTEKVIVYIYNYNYTYIYTH